MDEYITDQDMVRCCCNQGLSQAISMLYKTWVAMKTSGEVISGRYTCIAGLSEVWNHVGAVLYKCKMKHNNHSHLRTLLSNQWLPAKEVVPPVPIKEVNFAIILQF